MGIIIHHSIVVTGFDLNQVKTANKVARVLFKVSTGKVCDLVSDIITSNVNRYHSFFIAPDGSKDGWDESDKGDSARDQFVAWLQSGKGDGLYFVEVEYGKDCLTPFVARGTAGDY